MFQVDVSSKNARICFEIDTVGLSFNFVVGKSQVFSARFPSDSLISHIQIIGVNGIFCYCLLIGGDSRPDLGMCGTSPTLLVLHWLRMASQKSHVAFVALVAFGAMGIHMANLRKRNEPV